LAIIFGAPVTGGLGSLYGDQPQTVDTQSKAAKYLFILQLQQE